MSSAGWIGLGRWWAAVAAGTLLILAVVAVNGHPTVFTDTDDYYSLGKELVSDIGLGPPPPELSDADVKQAAIDAHMGHTQMASRSAIYSLFLYILESIGTLWFVTLIQALAVSWLALITWRVALPRVRRPVAVAALGVVAIVSPLAFFVGFAMPDIFAGVAVLAAVLLLIYPDRMGTGERRVAGMVLTFALAVHTSHILFMVPLVAAGGLALVWLRVDRRSAARRLGGVGLAVVVALAANSAYGIAVRWQTGDALRNQPFLTARLLADGPGRAYLRHACANGRPYVLCAFKAKPLSDSEDVLWSDLPATGVFMLSTYATRVKLEEQEARFVFGTLAYAPGAQFVASLRNWGRQLVLVQVDDPIRDPVYYLTDPYWKATNLPALIGRIEDCGTRGTGCPSRLTIALSRWWHGGALIIATGLVVAGAVRLRRSDRAGSPDDRRLLALIGLIVAGILLNAAVCGILSGPFARYQSRIVWLVPLLATLVVGRGRANIAVGGNAGADA